MLLKRGSALATALAAISLAVSAPSASAATCTGWTVAKTLPAGSSVHKVSALAGSAWAIGQRAGNPLVMRFDGTRWTETPVPEAAELDALHSERENVRGLRLGSVYARTATDVWAVGSAVGDYPGTEYSTGFPVTMHWDGAEWRFVNTPSPVSPSSRDTGDYTTLGDVVAFSADDVWAVGSYTEPEEGRTHPLAMHWDGSEWTLDYRLELASSLGALEAAARTPYANTLWAVGRTDGGTGLLARHRSGSWTQMTTRDMSLAYTDLRDVAVIAWNDAWAVGYGGYGQPPVALHRDGSRWSVVPTPGFGALDVVSAASSRDVWAVGRTSDSPSKPIMLHWDGASWTAVTPPAGIERLSDVAMRPSGWGWAVGYTATRSVILRHCPA